MKGLVLLQQSPIFYLGINLSRGNIGMAEHFLNDAQVSAPGEQMSGEGMTEQMGLHGGFNTCQDGVLFSHQPDGLPRNRPASHAQKKDATSVGFHQARPGSVQVDLNCLDRLVSYRHHPLLASFTASDPKKPVF
jgi:hypothetical protein